ncbi:unnamed protein product [Closterium sp. Yama58-4]|nr:unnamed protein product [Closterium sp. Yama58-4]
MLPALKKLSLLDLQIARLPESFHQLASLEAFHLSHCTAHFRFPAAFGDLTALRSLYILIAPNLILPDDIGELTNLHTLHFSRNHLQELLPSSFMQLTSLTRLELVDCAIVQLPGDMGRLGNLRELIIQLFTSITEIPHSLTDLVNLEVLKVLGCRNVSSFPTSLSSLARPKELALAKLPQLPQLLPSLPRSLEILSLGTYQRLTPFLAIPALPNLRRLSLISVAFMRGMVAGMALPAVEHVELSLVGEAEDLPLPLDLVPNLRSVRIASAGRLKSFPKKPVPFKIIFQLMNRLEIQQAVKLKELTESVTALHRLTSIEIHAPELASLPDGIGSLSRLRRLNLAGCSPLASLPASLTQLSCLHDLNLACTSVRSLPCNFGQLSRLKYLDLHACRKLVALPEDITQLEMLHSLNISGCDDDIDTDCLCGMHGLRIIRTCDN